MRRRYGALSEDVGVRHIRGRWFLVRLRAPLRYSLVQYDTDSRSIVATGRDGATYSAPSLTAAHVLRICEHTWRSRVPAAQIAEILSPDYYDDSDY